MMIACCDIVTVIACCNDCPNSLVLKIFFVKELLKTFEHDDTIRFSQWFSTDRSQFVRQEIAFGDFVNYLLEKFLKLTEHHYIAKTIANFLKKTKVNLKSGECIIYCS